MIAHNLRKSGPQRLSVPELSCRDPVRQDKGSLTLGHWMERPEERGKYTVYGQQKADKLASRSDVTGNAIQGQRTRTGRGAAAGSVAKEWPRPVHFQYKSFKVSAVVGRATSNPHSLLSYSQGQVLFHKLAGN